MSQIQTSDEVVSFVNTNFSYLTEAGFQIGEVEFQNNTFWAVNFEGKCCIRIDWYWRDGMSLMVSKSGTAVDEYWKWYAVDTLVCFLFGQEVGRKFYDDLMADKSDCNVQVYSSFLSVHLDKIIELVTDEQFEKHDFKLKQLRRTLDELTVGKH